MSQSPRIRNKILKYSIIFKCMGIIHEEDFTTINRKPSGDR
ncbi:hypothetical protein [Bacillus sp. AK128]